MILDQDVDYPQYARRLNVSTNKGFWNGIQQKKRGRQIKRHLHHVCSTFKKWARRFCPFLWTEWKCFSKDLLIHTHKNISCNHSCQTKNALCNCACVPKETRVRKTKHSVVGGIFNIWEICSYLRGRSTPKNPKWRKWNRNKFLQGEHSADGMKKSQKIGAWRESCLVASPKGLQHPVTGTEDSNGHVETELHGCCSKLLQGLCEFCSKWKLPFSLLGLAVFIWL